MTMTLEGANAVVARVTFRHWTYKVVATEAAAIGFREPWDGCWQLHVVAQKPDTRTGDPFGPPMAVTMSPMIPLQALTDPEALLEFVWRTTQEMWLHDAAEWFHIEGAERNGRPHYPHKRVPDFVPPPALTTWSPDLPQGRPPRLRGTLERGTLSFERTDPDLLTTLVRGTS